MFLFMSEVPIKGTTIHVRSVGRGSLRGSVSACRWLAQLRKLLQMRPDLGDGLTIVVGQENGPRLSITGADKAKTATESGVYRVTEIIGTSPVSWEEAAKSAVETAATSLRDLRVAEVEKLDVKIEDGKVVAFRAKISLSFKYEG